MSLKFQKKKEDFVCGNCGTQITGSGFTNHCRECLWSKHVDVYPGDRAGICQGMMEPVSVSLERDGYLIRHRCTRCGFEKTNKAASDDNIAKFLDTHKGL